MVDVEAPLNINSMPLAFKFHLWDHNSCCDANFLPTGNLSETSSLCGKQRRLIPTKAAWGRDELERRAGGTS